MKRVTLLWRENAAPRGLERQPMKRVTLLWRENAAPPWASPHEAREIAIAQQRRATSGITP